MIPYKICAIEIKKRKKKKKKSKHSYNAKLQIDKKDDERTLIFY